MFADAVELLALMLAAGWLGLLVLVLRGRGRAAPLALVLTIGGAVGLFGLQAVLSDAIDDAGGGATRLDTAVAAFAVGHRTPVLTAVAETLNVGGGLAGLTVLAAVVATALLARHRRLEAALVLAAPAAAGLLGNASKLGYDRARPPVAGHLVAVTDSSLPSGHTLDATIVLGVLALVVLSLVHGRLARAARGRRGVRRDRRRGSRPGVPRRALGDRRRRGLAARRGVGGVLRSGPADAHLRRPARAGGPGRAGPGSAPGRSPATVEHLWVPRPRPGTADRERARRLAN